MALWKKFENISKRQQLLFLSLENEMLKMKF